MAATPPERFARLWADPVAAPRSFRELGEELREAGFAAQAPALPERLAREVDFSERQLAELDACPDPWTAGELGDLMLGRARRMDLFVKPGGPPADPGALRLRGLFESLESVSSEDRRLTGLHESAVLSRATYRPVLKRLSREPTCSVAALADELGRAPAEAAPLLGALIGAGLAAPAAWERPEAVPSAALAASRKVEFSLVHRGFDLWAPSPLLGGAARRPAPGDASLRARMGLAPQEIFQGCGAK